jgi:hypothetical protein
MYGSTPGINEFKPFGFQNSVLWDVDHFDYNLGTNEVLLSGSVGSAKSILLAHLIVKHCLSYPKADFMIGRRALPKLKATLYRKIKEHLWEQGIDYKYNDSTACFSLPGGSKITALSWADNQLSKFGSYEFSGAAIEELTENKDGEFYEAIFERVGRLQHVPNPLIISATNPEAPSHWAYKRFFESKLEARHVYFSLTRDNPYLSKAYIRGLEGGMDPKRARRMLDGQWIELRTDVIYHAYTKEANFRDVEYQINEFLPIILAWDFNIGFEKPLSMVVGQFDKGAFHWFSEVVIDGADTQDSCEELAATGILDRNTVFIVHGDATGFKKDTRSKTTDYDIINKFLSNYRTKTNGRVQFEMAVPRSNPPIRTRHNVVNGYFCNVHKQRRCFVYKGAPTLDKGFRLAALREGASYIEDDSKPYQHCTTAAGYAIVKIDKELQSRSGIYSTRYR